MTPRLWWSLFVVASALLSYICFIQTRHQSTLHICKLRSSACHVSAATITMKMKAPGIHGTFELNSHVDTTITGSNCVILNYTGKICNVSPYRDNYDPISNVPIVNAAIAWQSPWTRQTYILILNGSRDKIWESFSSVWIIILSDNI